MGTASVSKNFSRCLIFNCYNISICKKEKLKGQALPINYLKHTNLIYKKLIKLFVKKIKNKKSFSLKKQNMSNGWYLPRFYTDISGAINWSWSGQDISLFIQACSKPYPGAFSFINFNNKDLKVIIYNSNYINKIYFTHPWFVGKIFYEDKNIIKISVITGHLIIKKSDIVINNNTGLKKLLGKTLHTHSDYLTRSLTNTPNIFKYK